MSRRCRSSLFAVVVAVAAVAAAGCSDDGDSSATSSALVGTDAGTARPGNEVVAGVLPAVDQIEAAVSALETELGGPQDYYEINATAQLVNLFVSLNNGAIAQPWLYVNGTLTAGEGQAASGGTLRADALDFNPDAIFSKLSQEVPGLSVESFYVHGDGAGNLLYGVLATSPRGGGLDIVLGADGSVKSVDPVS